MFLQRKIDLYICRWKRRHNKKTPKYPPEVQADKQPPNVLELCHDRITYQSLMWLDAAVKLIYAITPVSLAIPYALGSCRVMRQFRHNAFQ